MILPLIHLAQDRHKPPAKRLHKYTGTRRRRCLFPLACAPAGPGISLPFVSQLIAPLFYFIAGMFNALYPGEPAGYMKHGTYVLLYALHNGFLYLLVGDLALVFGIIDLPTRRE